jgi:2-polyprenyl-3-methyl-5-hydroxy-6-metoxy-1,4-benzoquinol methylase
VADARPAEPCDLCGRRSGRVLFRATDHRQGLGGRFCLVECDGCGLIRTEPRPGDLSRWYTADYGPHAPSDPISVRAASAALGYTSRPDRREWAAALVGWLVPAAHVGPALTAAARVLDVGAGTGRAVAAMRAAGVDAWGVEPSPGAVEIARSRGVGTVVAGTLEDSDLTGRAWHLIRFSHVLEHVPSPVATLRIAASSLAPDGRVVVIVPNFDGAGRRLFRASWDGLEVPRHLHHFTARTLARVFAAAGLAVDSIRTVAQFGLLPGTLDAWTTGGVRQRGWGRSIAVRAASYPFELALAAAGLGEGLLAVARPV